LSLQDHYLPDSTSFFVEAPVNVEQFKQQLQTLERELVARLGTEVTAARGASDDQRGAGDLAHVEEVKDTYFRLAATDSEILAEVRAAQGRIEEGSYGKCVVDGGPIEEKRLESVPWTPYCLKHQSELEERAQLRTPSL